VRNAAVLDREMLRDFATEIAEECRKNGTILETTLLPPTAANAA
jgi:LysR family transcriptional regulator, carnitine catabolism transcriptional activator